MTKSKRAHLLPDRMQLTFWCYLGWPARSKKKRMH